MLSGRLSEDKKYEVRFKKYELEKAIRNFRLPIAKLQFCNPDFRVLIFDC